jgi:hypothetical protein
MANPLPQKINISLSPLTVKWQTGQYILSRINLGLIQYRLSLSNTVPDPNIGACQVINDFFDTTIVTI